MKHEIFISNLKRDMRKIPDRSGFRMAECEELMHEFANMPPQNGFYVNFGDALALAFTLGYRRGKGAR